MASLSLVHSADMSKRIWLVFALVFAAFVMTAINRPPPSDAYLNFKVVGNTAYGFGTTDDRSLGVMRQFLKKNPNVDTLVLKQMPGTQDADINLRIARLIRKHGLRTHLHADSFIASGAVDLFLAGKERSMECGAQIGVHSWQSDLGFSPQDVGWDTQQRHHENFLRDMGINPAFYEFTRAAAPPEGLYILKPDDIERFDLLTTPLKCIAG